MLLAADRCRSKGHVPADPHLRHRQFGVLVTTSCVDLLAYKEIKEDQHPILILSAKDIVELLRRNGRGSVTAVKTWLEEEFPKEA
ncbi:hypothetical protein LB554_15055 [Mesorhizobium sp. CO1-1-11]|uniref:hypothetical protein n=1 Tax=Mesorhizobium sp. CO1-1-11 TaxID=2876636 RepID=UPI001CCEA8BE|nr:hypothetical protein [Mesorhizobium sp. CO1-1-11]MBZ9725268.1 hypothetical protein [Mesorhizobium sp. CO1-1-11]